MKSRMTCVVPIVGFLQTMKMKFPTLDWCPSMLGMKTCGLGTQALIKTSLERTVATFKRIPSCRTQIELWESIQPMERLGQIRQQKLNWNVWKSLWILTCLMIHRVRCQLEWNVWNKVIRFQTVLHSTRWQNSVLQNCQQSPIRWQRMQGRSAWWYSEPCRSIGGISITFTCYRCFESCSQRAWSGTWSWGWGKRWRRWRPKEDWRKSQGGSEKPKSFADSQT